MKSLEARQLEMRERQFKRSSEAVSRAQELVSRAKHQIEQSNKLVEGLEIKKSPTELLRTTYATRAEARKTRKRTETVRNDAKRLRDRLLRLDVGTARTSNEHRLKRQLTGRDEALAALKQTLSDLESVRMTLPNDPTLQKLKTDIRRAIARNEGNRS